MVKVTADKDHFVFQVQGMHKLWSMKTAIKVPKEHVIRAHNDRRAIPLWKGWRLPGTHVPFVITAGTYYKRGAKNFWDVMKERNAIVVELKDDKYKNLYIEVENPEETLTLLNNGQAPQTAEK